MICNQSDITELINKLETLMGRAKAVVDLSNQYQLPEDMVKEAIATFEAVYDDEEIPEEYKEQYKDRPEQYPKKTEPLKTAANLARRILWVDKAVDLVAKAREPEKAAEMAEEFGLDERALALFTEAKRYYKAIELAKKLEKWDEYIALCQKDNKHAAAISKCRELEREDEAKEIMRKRVEDAIKDSYSYKQKEFIELIQKTGMFDFVVEICRKKNKPKTLAKIAMQTGHHGIAFKNFKQTEQFVDAARQALQLTDVSAHYIGEARELFLKGVEKLENRKGWHSQEILALLKETLDKTGVTEGIEDKIFDYHIQLSLFDDGITYFEGRKDQIRTLKLMEAGDQLRKARELAKEMGLTNKVDELNEKLGWEPSLAEVAEEEEDLGTAITHYTSAIEESRADGSYSSAADAARDAAALCEKYGDTAHAESFKESEKVSRITHARNRTKEEEEKGYWDSAARYAEDAGDIEKAKRYKLLDTVIRAHHKP